MNYSYPLNSEWTTDEIIIVVNFLSVVEEAYENGISAEIFGQHYLAFKKIVNSISEEKQIDRQFQESSGFSIYQVVKRWKNIGSGQKIFMK